MLNGQEDPIKQAILDAQQELKDNERLRDLFKEAIFQALEQQREQDNERKLQEMEAEERRLQIFQNTLHEALQEERIYRTRLQEMRAGFISAIMVILCMGTYWFATGVLQLDIRQVLSHFGDLLIR